MPDPSAPEAPAGAAEPKRPAPLKRPAVRLTLLLILVVLVAAAVVWGLGWWTSGRFMQTTNDAYLRADQVTVSPQVSGYVTAVLVDDNQPVQAGQPLVRIDDRSYRATLEQQQANVGVRQADIAAARAQVGQQDAIIAQRRAELATAQTNVAYATHETSRYAPLTAQGVETAERLDQLRNNRDQAAGQAAADRAAVAAAERQTNALQAQIGQTEAQLKAAQAAVAQSQIDVDRTLIRASIAGRVGDRSVRLGQFVQSGARLMSVVPTQQVYLVANFKETQVGRMRRGQPVTIRVDALDGETLHGTVDSFAPGTGAQFALLPPENATGNFTKVVQRVPVRIRIDASPELRERLLPGLSVTATVDTRGAPDVPHGPAR